MIVDHRSANKRFTNIRLEQTNPNVLTLTPANKAAFSVSYSGAIHRMFFKRAIIHPSYSRFLSPSA